MRTIPAHLSTLVRRTAAALAAFGCAAAIAANDEPASGSSVERAATAVASGVHRVAAAAASGVERAASAVSRGVQRAQDAGERGARAAAGAVERGARAAGDAADRVARRIGIPASGASAPARKDGAASRSGSGRARP